MSQTWKQKFDAIKKLKMPKEPKATASEARHQVWHDKRAAIWRKIDAFYNEVREALGGKPQIGDHWFVEIDETTWIWISMDDTCGGVIDNVILGKNVKAPAMWQLAIDARPDFNDGEMCTLFLDNRTMLMWSKEHCVVRTGEYRRLS